MEVKKLNRLKVVMAEKDLSNIWLKRMGLKKQESSMSKMVPLDMHIN